jgi:metal-responsive CopG/Arc/MetJ family transcriptional regulator
MSEMSIIKLTVPQGLEKEIERAVKEGNYRTRQEFVLQVLREELGKNEPQAAKLGGSTA